MEESLRALGSWGVGLVMEEWASWGVGLVVSVVLGWKISSWTEDTVPRYFALCGKWKVTFSWLWTVDA